jgi:hypothetical protein
MAVNTTDFSAALGPSVRAVAITKSDVTTYNPAPRALYVGTTGDVKVDTWNGETITFTGVPAGAILPICFTKVYSTDTTAGAFVGLY